MESTASHTSDDLTINVTENDSIVLKWLGRSMMRNPGGFLTPILLDALNVSSRTQKRLVLDFCDLEYMNSSTITPVIKILERVRRGRNELTVLYNRSQRWQELSFSALRIFQTPDGRVVIKGND